jgi:hypothetical protein
LELESPKLLNELWNEEAVAVAVYGTRSVRYSFVVKLRAFVSPQTLSKLSNEIVTGQTRGGAEEAKESSLSSSLFIHLPLD